MKRIGIITFHRAINYGAVLQAIGLYQTIKKLKEDNIELELIDYRNDYIEKLYSPFYLHNSSFKKAIIKIPLYFGIKSSKKRKFIKFVKENTKLSKKYSKSSIKKAGYEYDIIITGSDQVWNDKCAQFDPAYFLDFVEESYKKNSYAASLGMNKLPQELEDEYKKRLQDFNNLSVREDSANDILRHLLKRNNIQTVLDPTLICDEVIWKKLACDMHSNEKYILLYRVNTPIELINFAKKLSKSTGYPIYFISDTLLNRDPDLRYLRNISPQEFLGLIKNAEYLVTNSFHGTVFSILFETNFYIELNTTIGVNNRAKELLEFTGLQERNIRYFEQNLLSDIQNWDEVKLRLNLERKKSLDYLKKVIEE